MAVPGFEREAETHRPTDSTKAQAAELSGAAEVARDSRDTAAKVPKGLAERAGAQIIESLQTRGLLGSDQLKVAQRRASAEGIGLVETLERSAEVEVEALLGVLEDVYGIPAVDFDEVLGDPLILPLIPRDLAFEVHAVPLYLVDGRLTTAMAQPEDLAAVDRIRFASGKEVEVVVALPGQLKRHLARAYGSGELDLLQPVEFGDASRHVGFRSTGRVALDEDHNSDAERQVTSLTHLMLSRALQESASSLQLEPRASRLHVRLRIDGHWELLPYDLPADIASSLVDRLLRLAGLKPQQGQYQEGRFRLRYCGSAKVASIATLPTDHGDRLTIRFDEVGLGQTSLESLGMVARVRGEWQRLLTAPQGLLLIAGPANSGRAETAAASRRLLEETGRNVVCRPAAWGAAGRAFSTSTEPVPTGNEQIRALLQQDPDVLILGELSDVETTTQALRVAGTGRLVIAYCAGEDSLDALSRLLDLGVSSSLLAAHLAGVLAQREVRLTCEACRDEGPVDRESLRQAPVAVARGHVPRREAGCGSCAGRGFEGRLGIHELLSVDEAVRAALLAADRSAALAAARQTGWVPLWLDGLDKVKGGLTTIRELLREVDLPGSVSLQNREARTVPVPNPESVCEAAAPATSRYVDSPCSSLAEVKHAAG